MRDSSDSLIHHESLESLESPESHSGADDEEGEAEEEYAKVDQFRLDVLLVKGKDSVYETYYHAASSYHRHNGYHRPVE